MAKGEMKKRIRGKGCLPWIAVFIVWVAWMNLVALKNPWSDEEAIELFDENWGLFELVRRDIETFDLRYSIRDIKGYTKRFDQLPASTKSAIAQLESLGIARYGLDRDENCTYFTFAGDHEQWNAVSWKSIVHCPESPKSGPVIGMNRFEFLLTADEDTDDFIGRAACFPPWSWIYRPIGENWYILQQLSNENRDDPCFGERAKNIIPAPAAEP